MFVEFLIYNYNYLFFLKVSFLCLNTTKVNIYEKVKDELFNIKKLLKIIILTL